MVAGSAKRWVSWGGSLIEWLVDGKEMIELAGLDACGFARAACQGCSVSFVEGGR